jgi:hypothetical protein
MSLGEQPFGGFNGAGKRPSLVAKKLAFEQSFRQGGTIQGDKILILSVAGEVNGLGDQFLTGAAFAVDVHR